MRAASLACGSIRAVAGLCASLLVSAVVSAQEPLVECRGVGWPTDYEPLRATVHRPSEGLANRGALIVPETRLEPLDAAALIAEDAARAGTVRPKRIGVHRPISGPVPGEWHILPDGSSIWMASLVSPEAQGIRVHFVDLQLPPGAALYYYGRDHLLDLTEPIHGNGPNHDGDFWGMRVAGDAVQIELHLPPSAEPVVPFEIGGLSHNYVALDAEDGGARASLGCMLDVRCAPQWPTWEGISYAVARMSYIQGPGEFLCTGQLLATQNNDLTPYFLTANHCVSTQAVANTLSFRWFYQTSSCNGPLGASQFSSGADLLAGDAVYPNGRDWTLLMVRGVLPAGVFWSGWTTANVNAGAAVHSISHPQGSWKRYAQATKQNTGVTGYQRVSFSLGLGTIDEGSSGSGIWTSGATPATQLLFGDCSFGDGPTNCDDPSNPTYYGSFQDYYPAIANYLAGGSDDGFEDGDSCATAADLASGAYSNLVVKSGDPDWYRFSAGLSNPIDIDLLFTDSHGNIDVQLYNACGGTVVASATSISDNEFILYQNTGATQTYYLRVYLVDDTRNEYSMTISGAAIDCNNNEIADECDTDCGLPGCSIPGCGQSPDCNHNLNPDGCDVGDGISSDCNGNSVPDECELGGNDCNSDQVPDDCELLGNDCNGNLGPDDCDEAALATAIISPTGQSPCPDGSASFTVSAPGATGYQWYRNGSEPLGNGGHVSGATAPTLTIEPATSADEGAYSCVVQAGCLTASSLAASLDLATNGLAATLVTATPASACAAPDVVAGLDVSVNDASAVSWQWSHEGNDLVDDDRISGANTAHLRISALAAEDNGFYTCRAINACMIEPVTATGELHVYGTFLQQPPATVCAEYGTNALIRAELGNPQPTAIRWYEGAAPLSNGSKFAGVTTTTLSVKNIQASDHGRQFRLRTTVAVPLCTTYSQSCAIQAQPGGGCPGCPNDGDMDNDGDYDLLDMAGFMRCMGVDVSVESACTCANVNGDNNVVDLADWTALTLLLAGPN